MPKAALSVSDERTKQPCELSRHTAPRHQIRGEDEKRDRQQCDHFHAAHQALAARLGADYTRTLQGKRIRVTGTAQRFHVASFTAGEDSKAFARTVIELQDAADLVVL